MADADDILVAIRLLAETKQAVSNINSAKKAVEQYLSAVEKANARAKLLGGGRVSIFPPEEVAKVKKLSQALNQIEPATKKAGHGLLSLNNIARTVFGTFTAMAVFFLTQFVGNVIKKSIEGAQQLELALYNLAVAEKTLSKAGIEINPQDFKNIIEAVKELDLAISDTDITKSVADLATGLQDLGLSPEQLSGLAKAAAIIAQSEGLTMSNVADQISGGIAKGGRGLADLDIQVDKPVIIDKAIEAQLIKDEEAYNNLTAAQKQNIETQALYLIIMDSANTKMEEMDLLQGSLTKATKDVSSEWENFTTLLGQISAPFLVSALELITKGIIGWGKSLQVVSLIAQRVLVNVVADLFTMRDVIDGNVHSLDDLRNAWERNREVASAVISDAFGTGLGTLPPDNPTAPVDDTVVETTEDIQGALEEMNDEILQAQIKLGQDMEEAQIDWLRKLADIANEYVRKRADAEREFSSKVTDINTDYSDKISDIRDDQANANQEARNKELEREAEFQNKMMELRERFLMDLEDALHARDARQVLRLIKEYDLAKTQAERGNELAEQSSKRENALRNKKFAQERADAERERQAKIAEAQRDYADKLAKLKADEEAERAAADLAYHRKVEDLEREMHDRLEIVASNLVGEYNLTQEGLDAILTLYQRYYAEVSAIYNAMNHMISGQQNMSGVVSVSSSGNSGFSGGGGGAHKNPLRAAEGGLGMASFTPIGRTGNDVNKVFSGLGGDGSATGGSMQIEMLLSPDLEARVVKNALSQTAQVIVKTQRTKG